MVTVPGFYRDLETWGIMIMTTNKPQQLNYQ